ncbi:MAG: LuxR family transcriptional regulator [Sedimentibacter sp.]|uniref:LuxR family transcriptional regulator n=1 Tax=Sedimentibacter sp. TaxID=1960295 RepID=UPI0031596180
MTDINNVASEGESSDSVTNYRVLRKRNYPYVYIWIVYYAWVVVFTTWWTASPLIQSTYGVDARNMLHSVNLISSAVFVFVLKREWFITAARAGSVLIVSGMAVFLLSKNPAVNLFSSALTGIFLGFVNISILIPFVLVLNNTEKFYAVVGSNILINVLSILKEEYNDLYFKNTAGAVITFAMLIAGLIAVVLFKEEDAQVNEPSKAEMPSRVYMTLVINCIFTVLCKGIAKGMLNSASLTTSMPVMNIYYAGGLVGCLLYFIVYKRTEKGIQLSWNITFGSITMGFLCYSFISGIEGLIGAFSVFLGIGSTMGMINMYYILGVIGKKYHSMKYVRMSILFIGICGGLAGVVLGNLVYEVNAFNVSVISSIASAGVMMLFLMFSPLLSETYYSDEWAGDSQKIEVDNEHLQMFRKYNLSKRETEVCKLLLEGYTLRQISAIMSIAYPTVNTYCTSLYRKLSINSRTELFILFKDYPIKSRSH